MEENIKIENNKKIKNLISIIILLSGLFLGSLFVDFGQIIKGSGYSQKNLNKSDIFVADKKTWVAYDEPAISVSVISDDACEKCDPSEVLVWFRRVLPTISNRKIAFDSEEGKKMIADFELKTLPAFVFDGDLAETDFFVQAEKLFKASKEQYVLDTQALGVPVGKYTKLPEINENDSIFGKKDAKTKVVIFSDFQCPNCKLLYKSLREIMKDYEDKVTFIFKDFYSDVKSQTLTAALSAECALSQDKFWEYADNLYEKQAEWSGKKDSGIFKIYAKNLKLDTKNFNTCLDEKKFQEKVDINKKEAEEIGFGLVPAIFINDQFESSVFSVEQLKKSIDAQLSI